MPRTGRPKIDDKQTLLAMADEMIKNPDFYITDAIRSVVKDFTHEQSEDSAIRRLRDKFREDRDELEAWAREKAAPRKVYIMSPTSFSFQAAKFCSLAEAMRDSISSPEIRRAARLIQTSIDMPERLRASLDMTEVQRVIKNIAHVQTSLQTSLNTPEMRGMFEKLRNTSTVIGGLSQLALR